MSTTDTNPDTPLTFETVKVDFEDGIGWVTLNRPDKRNAMSPTLNREMMEVLDALEFDDRAKVLVLTGAGEAFTAGMDLKEYFREVQGQPPAKVAAVRRAAAAWQWRKLMYYGKPTIAMVNGWCFGGDLAFCADEAQFGLSEINWGILPGGGAMHQALLKNWVTLKAANSLDSTEGRKEGIRQFIDEKSYKPELAPYDKSKARNKSEAGKKQLFPSAADKSKS